MPTDYGKEFDRYLERFGRLVGDIRTGQYGTFRERLVRKLDADEFRQRVDDYMSLGRRFTDMVSAGDTIDDTVAVELRAVEVELVMERSLFLPERR
ncbi:MAG: hypothetical protein R3F60_09235 [bacterium]